MAHKFTLKDGVIFCQNCAMISDGAGPTKIKCPLPVSHQTSFDDLGEEFADLRILRQARAREDSFSPGSEPLPEMLSPEPTKPEPTKFYAVARGRKTGFRFFAGCSRCVFFYRDFPLLERMRSPSQGFQ
eukprot:gnl/Spiro4/25278_TR12583_c0_g1_i1.p1 gnl/Spiro4/25278_TR12583_c0_g1~~gnl/Spiro4/25278_TR12583_c0_g1_i1.p1  ORF type:complete len:138 (+),score=8.14 gnl/Spiro4/25278_TR12583_c0_g1_i1:30-416(+)